jgi:hypothetical protein
MRSGGRCVKIIVDKYGKRKVEGSKLKKNKDNEWIGGEIEVKKSGERMVICEKGWKNEFF